MNHWLQTLSDMLTNIVVAKVDANMLEQRMQYAQQRISGDIDLPVIPRVSGIRCLVVVLNQLIEHLPEDQCIDVALIVWDLCHDYTRTLDQMLANPRISELIQRGFETVDRHTPEYIWLHERVSTKSSTPPKQYYAMGAWANSPPAHMLPKPVFKNLCT